MQITPSTVALVTGAAGGLGLATARSVVDAGGQVVLVDLPGEAGERAAAELGERAHFAPADVRSDADIRAAVQQAAALGDLRLAVCCAGVVAPGRLLGRKGPLDLDAYRQVIEINLVGTFNVLRLAAEQMAGQEPVDGDRGVVVMTASAAAYDGQVGQAAYASSKGAIVSLTLSAARDLADKAIRVMTIAPGVMGTPMMAGLPPETKDMLEAGVPHPSRYGRPEEYAALVRHILENPYLNGETIRLDGSLRMPPR